MKLLSSSVARIIFAVAMLIFGLMHLMAGADMAGMVPSFFPGGVIWVYITGLGLILAGIAIIIKKMGKLASFLLALMLLIFVLSIHLPAVIGGDQMAMSQVLKDLGLMACALLIAGQLD